jgi:hypothetical protein
VGAEQDVCLLHLLVSFGAHGVTHDPGIDKDGLSAWSCNAESRMAQPREFDSFEIHQCSIQILLKFMPFFAYGAAVLSVKSLSPQKDDRYLRWLEGKTVA